RPRLRQYEAAEGVDPALVLGEGDVMRGQRHRVLLRPAVRARVVLVHHADRLPARREAAEHIKLAVGRRTEQLLGRLRKRRELHPAPLREDRPPANHTEEKRNPENRFHLLPLLPALRVTLSRKSGTARAAAPAGRAGFSRPARLY